jgi:hypothetical protein
MRLREGFQVMGPAFLVAVQSSFIDPLYALPAMDTFSIIAVHDHAISVLTERVKMVCRRAERSQLLLLDE